MKCPYCGYSEDKVLESRSVKDGEAMRRRRECAACERRYTTYEQIEERQVMVVKRDGRREPFDRGKILRGMMIACRKRPVGVDRLETVVDGIERAVLDTGRREVRAEEIGEAVSEELRNLDQVAYVRFASVYRHFEDVGQFRDILAVLDEHKAADRS